MRPQALSRHPFVSLLVLTGLILAVLAGYAIQRGSQFASTEAGRDLEARARIAQTQATILLQRGDLEGLRAFCAAIAAATGTRITILLPTGTVLADSHEEPARMENHAGRPEIMAALRHRVKPAQRYSYTLHTEMLYVAVPLEENRALLGVLRTALPMTEIDRRLDGQRRAIILAAVLLFMLAMVAIWFISRQLRLPLRAMRNWATGVAAAGQLSRRLTVTGPDAIIDLATALDQMATRLTERATQISQQRNELEAVFGSMVEGVLTVDAEERVQSFNPAALTLLGLDPGRVKGRSTLEAVRNLELQRFIKATLSGKDTREGEIVLPDTKGANRSFYLRGVPLKSDDNHTTGALIVLGDVTNLRRLETVRRDFVANVSHELKTPITSITGFVETLLDGALDEPENARHFLEIIHKQSKRLHAIVEDLLALSRLEQGAEKQEIALTPHPLTPLIEAAIQTCGPAATARKIIIRQECPGALAARLNPPLLEQALVNLVDNAIKYSPAGSTVLVSATAAENEVIVAVQDQGVGIAPRDQPRIFERFFRVDKARSSTMGGTGLGLSIVRHIVQAHGGRITLTSTPGKGSTFAVHLPTANV